MASNTSNVKLGVCKVFFDGIDLGYTKGGVEVDVSTETHKVEVDQFGKSPINELIMGRSVKATVPLAETTVENMARIMPGATVVATGGAKATGTVTLSSNPTNGQTVLINGKTIKFVTSAAAADEVTIGATAALTAAALNTVLNASTDPLVAVAQYSVAAAIVTVTYNDYGTVGNAFTLAAGTSGATVSAATLAGGTEPTAKRVDVTDAVSTNLLSIAKELRLHPQDKPDSDQSDDFVIPRAATAGALKFAYKLEDERIFNCEFMGYPDPVTRKLFQLGA